MFKVTHRLILQVFGFKGESPQPLNHRRAAMKEITTEVKKQFNLFWMTQRKAIKGRVSVKTMYWFNAYTERDNVGYEDGQLRPEKLGQWDLYWSLTGEQSIGCDENETLIASGLTAGEVAESERREYYRDNLVNPDNKLEIAWFNRVKGMSPAQLDAEITRLERDLAEDE